jgi:translation elongation factor EF-Ts
VTENLRLILELQRRSALPLLKCREALKANDWDLEKALRWLQEKYPAPYKMDG